MGLLCRDFINEYRQWPQRNLQTGYSLAKKVDSHLYLETLNCYGTRDWRKDMSDSIGVGLIGLGTVGSGVVELLQDAVGGTGNASLQGSSLGKYQGRP